MRRALRYAEIIGAILLVILVGGLIVAGIFGQLLTVLYIVLIILAFFSLFATALLVYAVAMLIRTIMVVRNEMKPLLSSATETVEVAKETAEKVKETAHHAGRTAGVVATAAHLTTEYTLAPAIRATALMLASRQMLKVFLGKGHARTRAEERRQKQMRMIEAAGGGE